MLKPIWVLRCRCDKVSTTKLSNPLDFFGQTFPGFSKGFHLENTWVVKQAVSILLCDEVDHDELKLKRLRKVLDKSLGLNNRSSLVWPSAQTFTHTHYIYIYLSKSMPIPSNMPAPARPLKPTCRKCRWTISARCCNSLPTVRRCATDERGIPATKPPKLLDLPPFAM